jgi:hypothetical protein
MKLPLDLAIAILTDADGRINVAMPVRGNIDHPDFSYSHALAGVRHGHHQSRDGAVPGPRRAVRRKRRRKSGGRRVRAGQGLVLPPEREKLKRVGEVLGKRPQLKVTVLRREAGRRGAARLARAPGDSRSAWT